MKRKKRILLVFGTRPEAIKMAPVYACAKKSPRFILKICVTGQHRQMLDQVMRIFCIKADYDLNVMEYDQTLATLTSSLTHKLSRVLEDAHPDIVIVQGDTTTAFIVSLLAFYKHISIGHMEAGLRSFNKFHPFPEEINRRLISHTADLHFAPTQKAKRNLISEGIPKKNIFVTGNTAIDALFAAAKKVKRAYPKFKNINFRKKLILVTAHRRESFGKPLKAIFRALIELSKRDDVEIVYPVHFNPNVHDEAYRMLRKRKNIHLAKPVSYDELVYLMKKAKIILTDSGGIQEEAPSLGKPILVLREVTERPEGVKAQVAKVVGTNTKNIVREATRLLNSKAAYKKMAKKRNPYGDGRAASRIVRILNRTL